MTILVFARYADSAVLLNWRVVVCCEFSIRGLCMCRFTLRTNELWVYVLVHSERQNVTLGSSVNFSSEICLSPFVRFNKNCCVGLIVAFIL